MPRSLAKDNRICRWVMVENEAILGRAKSNNEINKSHVQRPPIMSYENAGIQQSKIGQLLKDWFISIGWRLGYGYSLLTTWTQYWWWWHKIRSSAHAKTGSLDALLRQKYLRMTWWYLINLFLHWLSSNPKAACSILYSFPRIWVIRLVPWSASQPGPVPH